MQGKNFIDDFFGDLLDITGSGLGLGDRDPNGRMKIIGKVRNGKSWLFHDQDSDTYWRTLKSAKMLYPATQCVKNPRNLDKARVTFNKEAKT